jgi:hypothetical protein
MATASQNYQGNFGWEINVYPNEQLLILNVPQSENVQQTQYVMNTLTGAWCYFIGWNANTFAIYNNNLYWGSNNGLINQGYIGSGDYLASIQADMQCAFNWLDEPGRTKRMTMVQPLLTTSGGLTPTMAIDTDFMTSSATAPITILTAGALWDVAMWDVAVWGGSTTIYNNFLSVQALGHALAIRMRVNIAPNTVPQLSLFDTTQFDAGEFDTELDTTVPILQVNAFNSIAELGGAI